MPKAPRLPRTGNPASRSGSSSPWADLIAFLAVLALGGVLISLGHTTAGSLAAICAALGSLYAVWARLRLSGHRSGPDETDDGRGKPPS